MVEESELTVEELRARFVRLSEMYSDLLKEHNHVVVDLIANMGKWFGDQSDK